MKLTSLLSRLVLSGETEDTRQQLVSTLTPDPPTGSTTSLRSSQTIQNVPPSHKVAAGATKLALFEMGRTIDLTIETS